MSWGDSGVDRNGELKRETGSDLGNVGVSTTSTLGRGVFDRRKFRGRVLDKRIL